MFLFQPNLCIFSATTLFLFVVDMSFGVMVGAFFGYNGTDFSCCTVIVTAVILVEVEMCVMFFFTKI